MEEKGAMETTKAHFWGCCGAGVVEKNEQLYPRSEANRIARQAKPPGPFLFLFSFGGGGPSFPRRRAARFPPAKRRFDRPATRRPPPHLSRGPEAGAPPRPSHASPYVLMGRAAPHRSAGCARWLRTEIHYEREKREKHNSVQNQERPKISTTTTFNYPSFVFFFCST
eukprot:gene10171-7125_t